jgi:hypothetical protein
LSHSVSIITRVQPPRAPSTTITMRPNSQQVLFKATVVGSKAAPSSRGALELLAAGTVLVSRTLMLKELSILLDEMPVDTTQADYDRAIKADNVLRKASAMNRAKTAQLLRNLYVLDGGSPIFRALRRLWPFSPEGQPLLALLVAFARESLLRATWPVVRNADVGSRIQPESFRESLQAVEPQRYSKVSLSTTAQHAASTWTQAGYLSGVNARTRRSPTVTPAVVALALFLGYLEGRRGQWLFSTIWTELLQISNSEVLLLAAAASRQGILHMLQAGDVVEVRFPGWLTPEEEAVIREQA